MNIKELERVARAATPGVWQWVGRSLEGQDERGYWVADIMDPKVSCGAYCQGGSVDLNIADNNAAFIAAANPQTILALIERLRFAEEVVDEITAWDKRDIAAATAAAYRAKYPAEDK